MTEEFKDQCQDPTETLTVELTWGQILPVSDMCPTVPKLCPSRSNIYKRFQTKPKVRLREPYQLRV